MVLNKRLFCLQVSLRFEDKTKDILCLQMSLKMRTFYVQLRKPLSNCLLSVLRLVRTLQSDCILMLLFPQQLDLEVLPLFPGLANPVVLNSSLHQNIRKTYI